MSLRGYSEIDSRAMTEALRLASEVKGRTCPNPAVGAVVIKDGGVVGIGATAPPGGPHAEITALRMAGKKARGATLYVTLEPCCHWGRTGPCTEAIIEAGIRRVIAAVKDPNPLVKGKGLRALKREGIEVCTGLLETEATRLNEDFFFSIVHHRAWVTLKLAMTLDGRIADSSDESRWITSERSRALVHQLRAHHSAIAIGRGTLVKDNPQLTVRTVPGASPARVIFSSSPLLPARSRLREDIRRIRTILVGPGAPRTRSAVGRNGVELWNTGTHDRVESVRRFLSKAYTEGLTSVFVEGGQELASVLMENRFVNRLYLFYGNGILGDGRAGFLFSKGLTMNERISLEDMEVQAIGNNIMVTGLPKWAH